ncbi:MAG: ribose 5-phosphate isomerase A [Bdellovibrionales bacterium]|nr:ribose 5-phosphate isomerase A [Bdellovibrionales bacterium]
MKERVAEIIAARVRDGDLIGIGTGSTVDLAIEMIGDRIKKEGLNVSAVTTSHQSAWKSSASGIKVLHAGTVQQITWGFDGIDAVDRRCRAIKGKGAAMLQEKILAVNCLEYLLIGDSSKLCDNIAKACTVPVEVVPEARWYVEKELRQLDAVSVALREAKMKHGPVITEAGNIILDVKFENIADELEIEISAVVGVVESGLFLDYASQVLIAGEKEVTTFKPIESD